jgi:hypothetical protein
MGGSASNPNSNLGVLRINLDTYEVSSGDYLYGTLGLIVYDNINTNCFNIEFFGETEVSFTRLSTTTEDDKRTTQPETYTERRVVSCYSKAVYAWPDRIIRPGQYVLPFSVRVPSGIPSSLNWSKRQVLEGRVLPDTVARVVYKVSAWVIPGIQDTVGVGVHQRDHLPSYKTSLEVHSNVSKWCSSKGSVNMVLSLNKEAYYIGDDIHARLMLDTSQAQIKPAQFKAELWCRLHLEVSYNTDTSSELIDTCAATLSDSTDSQELFLHLRLLPDRLGSLSTLKSDLIRCEFFIAVYPVSSGCCVCFRDMSCEMKIAVYSRILPHTVPVPPSNWSPNILEASRIEFNELDSRSVPSAPPLN